MTSQTVALDAEDAAAVDELLTAYHESLRVQTELLQDVTYTDYCSNDSSSSSSAGSLMPPVAQHLRSPHSSASSIPDLVNVAELSVRRVIAMAKQVQQRSLFRACVAGFRHPGTYPKKPGGFLGYTHLKNPPPKNPHFYFDLILVYTLYATNNAIFYCF